MKREYLTIGLYLLPFFIFTSCTNNKDNVTPTQSEVDLIATPSQALDTPGNSSPSIDSIDYLFPYNTKTPSHVSTLSSLLLEISSLSFKDGILYATNDEKGYIYKLDPNSGKILEKQKFGKNGDYEGVEIIKNGDIYVLKSNGDLFLVGKNETQKFKTDLSATNDVEGLGYLADQNLLLLACKGSPNLKGAVSKIKNTKAVYSWSTINKKMNLEPHLLIKDSELISYFKKSYSQLTKSKKKKFTKRLKSFAPSCIAYNDFDKNYYLLSTVGKLLVVISANSEIVHIEFLKSAYFTQPEGICFDQNNNMYVSNEGRGLVAKILKFERK